MNIFALQLQGALRIPMDHCLEGLQIIPAQSLPAAREDGVVVEEGLPL